MIDPRPLEDDAVGFCWWIATCGGVDVEPPPPFEPPAGFDEVDSGSTDLFDYTVYRAPEPTAVERPADYLIPRYFVQPPG